MTVGRQRPHIPAYRKWRALDVEVQNSRDARDPEKRNLTSQHTGASGDRATSVRRLAHSHTAVRSTRHQKPVFRALLWRSGLRATGQPSSDPTELSRPAIR